mmetsp:Transcript_93886/g.166102  ORF Transcript_93886/g.166102 Transcript_93886/m.166102 type:complete len:102 (+) Transcript_93886:3-308(+)
MVSHKDSNDDDADCPEKCRRFHQGPVISKTKVGNHSQQSPVSEQKAQNVASTNTRPYWVRYDCYIMFDLAEASHICTALALSGSKPGVSTQSSTVIPFGSR